MPMLLVYTPKGLVEIDPKQVGGRLHKLRRTSMKIEGKYYERTTLLRIAEKLAVVDKRTGIVFRHNNWGIAMTRQGRNMVPELDVVSIRGELRPAHLYERRK